MNPVLTALRKRDLQTRLKEEDGRLIISSTQDCTPIAEHCKALHNEGFHGSKEMRHAASFPKVIVEKYLNMTGVTFEQFMADPVHVKRMCNDPINKDFRIWPGRV